MSWHYVTEFLECVSSPCLPELEEGFSPASWPDTERSRLSRSTLIAERSCCVAKETACYPCSRSGTTSTPSTVDRGVESWIWSMRASRVNHSASLEGGEERTTLETSGQKPSGSFARWDPTSRCWRTSQVCLFTRTSESFSGTWPRAGSMQSGTVSRRPPSAPLTKETGSGYLPTPDACVRTGYNQSPSSGAARRPTLAKWAEMFPTPTARDSTNARNETARRLGPSKAHPGTTLCDHVTKWPTPKARDHRSDRKSQQSHSPDLNEAVGGKLNPTWVEWLMGWPSGWTALEPLETGRFRKWRDEFSPRQRKA